MSILFDFWKSSFDIFLNSLLAFSSKLSHKALPFTVLGRRALILNKPLKRNVFSFNEFICFA